MNSNEHDKIAILTDTDCDIPADMLSELPLYILPLRITDEKDVEYRDGVNITVDDIYRRQTAERFKTSLPSSEDLLSMFDRIYNDGFKKVIVLMLGDMFSGSSNLVRLMAEDQEDLDIEVYDSRSGSVGVGILAWQAALYAKAGMSFEKLKELIKSLIHDTTVFFSIDTLTHLQRGGRIGRATELIGTLLQIKPILTFSKEDSVISIAAKARGKKAVIKQLLECVRPLAASHPGAPCNLVICDGGEPERCGIIEEELKRMFPNFKTILHGKIDAVLAVHLGPNLLGCGVQFLPETE